MGCDLREIMGPRGRWPRPRGRSWRIFSGPGGRVYDPGAWEDILRNALGFARDGTRDDDRASQTTDCPAGGERRPGAGRPVISKDMMPHRSWAPRRRRVRTASTKGLTYKDRFAAKADGLRRAPSPTRSSLRVKRSENAVGSSPTARFSSLKIANGPFLPYSGPTLWPSRQRNCVYTHTAGV